MPGQVQSVGTAEAVALFQLQSRANSQAEVTTWLPSGYQMVYRRYNRLAKRRDANTPLDTPPVPLLPLDCTYYCRLYRQFCKLHWAATEVHWAANERTSPAI